MQENKKPKEKRRNSEKRKEKSRDAARTRRNKETEIFTDLGLALPLPVAVSSQLDKATVMRLTIASLKIMNALSSMEFDETPFGTDLAPNMNEICNKALDGIVLILTADGDIIFISENVSSYLGLSQIDLIGQSIYEFSHLCDQAELKEMLTGKDLGVQKSFFTRMKCTITNKGRNVNLKSASYKVLHFTGHTVANTCVKHEQSVLSTEEYDSDYESDKKTDSDNKSIMNNSEDSNVNKITTQIFVSIAEPIPHPSNIEIPLYKKSKIFFSKHSLDMKYIIADDVITKHLGYEPDSLVSKSVFDYYHAEDCNSIKKSFKILFQKGQVETNRYRFLSSGGGYVWVVTQATILNDYKGQKPESIMCINYIISGVEHGDEIYSLCQVVQPPRAVETDAATVGDGPQAEPPKSNPVAANRRSSSTEKAFRPKCLVDSSTFLLPAGDGPVHLDSNQLTRSVKAAAAPVTTATAASFVKKKPAVCSSSESPKAATTDTFAPRTKDMNKGFLTFSDDDTGLTMLKDEPEDLTHLAPTAGDVCVPLATCGQFNFVMSDVIDDLILSDCSLAPFDTMPLHDAYSSATTTRSSSSPMQHVGDDQMSQHAADLCDPTMTTFLGMDLDGGHCDLDLDLSLKNQFLPMYEDDLYPLLSNDSLWDNGARSPSPCNKPPNVTTAGDSWRDMQEDNRCNEDVTSPPQPPSLAKLLKTEAADNSGTAPSSRQQHFDSGGGVGLMDGEGQDSWGSISKMLHQRYNSSRSPGATEDANAGKTNGGVKRLQGPNATAPAPSSWKRSKLQRDVDGGDVEEEEEETVAKRGASNSVLMNLLVSGCDDGATTAAVPGRGPAGDPAATVRRGKNGTPPTHHRSRLKSSCLLDPGSAAIPSLMDLTEQDYDVNAPATNGLLQGSELLKALDIGSNVAAL